MAAFLIMHRREILDSERLRQYRDGVQATIDKFGGKVAVRADRFEVLEGEWRTGAEADDARPERITILEFPDMQALKAWYDSDEYAPLKAIRQASARSDIAAVEGSDP